MDSFLSFILDRIYRIIQDYFLSFSLPRPYGGNLVTKENLKNPVNLV
jgi:hypothetical protein